MRKTTQMKRRKPKAMVLTALSLSFALSLLCLSTVQAESLFRASANYSSRSQSYTPNSYIAQPIPHGVGDIVTIIIDESSRHTTTSDLKTGRSQNVTGNSSSIFSRLLHRVGLPEKYGVPNLGGLNNNNDFESDAEATRTTQLKEIVTCQVIQRMQNGNLVVQGVKKVLVNKDLVSMMVTGTINPYYLNQENEITSTRVANFQMVMGGKGVVTRQQRAGFLHKLHQFFN